jgi:putative FmdB family regulatory protein
LTPLFPDLSRFAILSNTGGLIVPTYDYVCQGCSYRFEMKQSIKDDPIATCSRCGRSVKRIISAPAIMFKGSGWYVTDYSDKLKPPSSESSDRSVDAKKGAATGAGTTPAGSGAAAGATPPASSNNTSSSGSSTSST